MNKNTYFYFVGVILLALGMGMNGVTIDKFDYPVYLAVAGVGTIVYAVRGWLGEK